MPRSMPATSTSGSSWKRRSGSMPCSRSASASSGWSRPTATAGVEGELARRVRLARLASESGQRERALAERIIESEARLGSLFSRHRGQLRGREVNDNEIAKVLRESSDRAVRREAWDASKSIGPHAAPLVRELAHLRNQAAQALGYRDHFAFSLTLDELDETWLLSLLDDLEVRLAATWERTKAAIDEGQRARLGLAPGETLQAWDYADAFFQDAPTASDDPLEAALEHLDPGRGRARLLPGARRRRRRRDRAQRPVSARRQEPARVLRRHRPPPRRARARELRAGHALARDDGARARARRLRPRDRRAAALAAAPARAHVHDRGDRDAARPARARRDVPRALRPRRARDRARSAQRRDGAPRAARLRALGAGHDALRARALPRPGSGSRRGLVAARRALPARDAAAGPAARRLGLQDPRRAGARLLPELPARRGHGVAARGRAGARDRSLEPGRRSGRGRGVPARALHAPGLVDALGRADRARDGRAAHGRPPRRLAHRRHSSREIVERGAPACCS